MEIKDKEKLAEALISGKLRHDFDQTSFYRLYPFCNENTSGYLDFLDLEGKSLLTVGSSLDQTICAISRGCTDITVLDLCPFTEEYFYLKKSAIETLTPEEFAQLFFYRDYPYSFFYNRKSFDLNRYSKLLKLLERERPDIYDFWMGLVRKYGGEKIRRSLFVSDEEKPAVTKQLTDYLKSEENYYTLREKIKEVNPTFIVADITRPSLDLGQYDNINLSNLTTYLSQEEIERLFNFLQAHLTEEGRLILGYLYQIGEYPEYCEGWDAIYDIEHIMSTHPDIKLKTIQGVSGMRFKDSGLKDAVYVYQKKK